MKIAISSLGKDITAQIDPRFGRCRFFVVVDTKDMQLAAFENENADQTGGAGIRSAAFLIDKGVDLVITGRCGPNAMDVFTEKKIQVICDQAGTVESAIERYKTKAAPLGASGKQKVENLSYKSQEPDSQTGQSRCMGGSGRGMGRGGCGMGGSVRGMGMGRGSGSRGAAD
ncbi:MAG: NifB/NifX family molybdenum-iron cluster-binding protein [Proteobacteria bacterium]|nr:dinitrogenase iron-molybdenum cofactor biosynthesis protein [Desulfobacula sp.]MBU3951166.1 NifB/NifX family molybdenum-iron cluster-binding protein [Pseudomonadota bacterium]MBU4133533.1 NifB/NifX family molybdenum-iron cluster-binding protein [Pseudomonadota bacterium]